MTFDYLRWGRRYVRYYYYYFSKGASYVALQLFYLFIITYLQIILISVTICHFVPFQGPFMAFCGCVCTNLLAVIFPCIMEICLLYPDRYGQGDWILVKDIIILATGLFCWVTGVFACIHDFRIRERLTKGVHPF